MEDLEEDEDFDAFNARETVDDGLAGGNSGPTRGDDYDTEREAGEEELEEDISDFDREDESDDLMGTGLKRANSAKQIRQPRLTAQDYVKDKDAKKGKYGVTVPKPFAFDLRDKTRPKTIHERKAERAMEEKRV
jgi:hypothetical protein